MVGMGIELIVVGVIVLVIFLLLIIDVIIDNYQDRKREEALKYLLELTDQIYFYGRSATECIKKGAVSELRWDKVGDFSRVFGGLVLSTLFTHGNDSARLHWKYQPEEGDLLPEHYSALVTFKHGGKRWELLIRGRCLEGFNFHRANALPDRDYTTWSYLDDMPRKDRYAAENCADPHHSYPEPDFCYVNLTEDAFREKAEETLQRLGI